jgi:hypothetical protein
VITLNEVALAALLETEDGPVGRHVQRVAQAVVVEAQKNVQGYFGTAPSLFGRVDQDVDFEMEGSSATIGIRDGGNKAQRLAAKQADGTFPWLSRALNTVRSLFGGG